MVKGAGTWIFLSGGGWGSFSRFSLSFCFSLECGAPAFPRTFARTWAHLICLPNINYNKWTNWKSCVSFCWLSVSSICPTQHRLYQRKVDVGMLNTVKNVLAEASSVSPSSKQLKAGSGIPLTQSLRRSVYPHQPFVSTVHVPALRWCSPALVLTDD